MYFESSELLGWLSGRSISGTEPTAAQENSTVDVYRYKTIESI